MFLHVSVILFTAGSAPLHAGLHPPGTRGRPPPAQCMLGDTGNKRAVRILLECNLVYLNSFITGTGNNLTIVKLHTQHGRIVASVNRDKLKHKRSNIPLNDHSQRMRGDVFFVCLSCLSTRCKWNR